VGRWCAISGRYCDDGHVARSRFPFGKGYARPRRSNRHTSVVDKHKSDFGSSKQSWGALRGVSDHLRPHFAQRHLGLQHGGAGPRRNCGRTGSRSARAIRSGAYAIKDGQRKAPWAFWAEVEKTARIAIERRYRLLPYLYTLFREAAVDGTPIMQPAFFADPCDARLRREKQAFLFGGDPLVIPAWAKQPALPGGIWRNASLIDGDDKDHHQIGTEITRRAIIPLGKAVQNTSEASLDLLTLLRAPVPVGPRATLRQLTQLVHTIAQRVSRCLQRQGLLDAEYRDRVDAAWDDDPMPALLAATTALPSSSWTNRTVFP